MPANRRAEPLRKCGDEHLLRVGVELRTESATHVGHDGVDLLAVDADRSGNQDAVAEDVLAPHADLEPVVMRDGDRRVRFERHRRQTLVADRGAHDDVGVIEEVGHRFGRLSVGEVGPHGRMEHGRIRLERSPCADHRRERIDVGEHEPGGVFRLAFGFGDDDGDDLADESHGVDCEGRPGKPAVDAADTRRPRIDVEICSGEDADDPRHLRRNRRLYRANRPVGDLGADRRHEQRTGYPLVGDVRALALYEAGVFRSLDCGTKDRSGHGGDVSGVG